MILGCPDHDSSAHLELDKVLEEREKLIDQVDNQGMVKMMMIIFSREIPRWEEMDDEEVLT